MSTWFISSIIVGPRSHATMTAGQLGMMILDREQISDEFYEAHRWHFIGFLSMAYQIRNRTRSRWTAPTFSRALSRAINRFNRLTVINSPKTSFPYEALWFRVFSWYLVCKCWLHVDDPLFPRDSENGDSSNFKWIRYEENVQLTRKSGPLVDWFNLYLYSSDSRLRFVRNFENFVSKTDDPTDTNRSKKRTRWI